MTALPMSSAPTAPILAHHPELGPVRVNPYRDASWYMRRRVWSLDAELVAQARGLCRAVIEAAALGSLVYLVLVIQAVMQGGS